MPIRKDIAVAQSHPVWSGTTTHGWVEVRVTNSGDFRLQGDRAAVEFMRMHLQQGVSALSNIATLGSGTTKD